MRPDDGTRGGTVKLVGLALVLLGVLVVQPARAQLFLSEYVEGSGNNKALEIYNPTSSPISLAGVTIDIYLNGSTTPSSSTPLGPGTIAGEDTWVIANPSIQPSVLPDVDQVSASIAFNGDDAVVLVVDSSVVDAIGEIGFDPGLSWSDNGVSTRDATLRRTHYDCSEAGIGTYDPSLDWNTFGLDNFAGLGSEDGMFSFTLCPSPAVPAVSFPGLIALAGALVSLGVLFSGRVRS
jgi:predicted extracellular nuclease